jgi:hypothetical protein
MSSSSCLRRVLALGIVMATGCSAILGLQERPIDDGPTRDASGDDDGTNDATAAVDANADSASEDAKDERIPCLGRLERAYWCDDFETPTLSPQWTVESSGPEAKIEGFAPPPSDGGLKAPSGVRVLSSGFDPIPDSGDAFLRFKHPIADGGPLGIRFAFYLLEDSWPFAGERVPIAGLKTATNEQITLVFVPIAGQNGDGNIELDVPGQSTIQLGPSSKNTWLCYQIVFTGKEVEAYVGNTPRDYRPFAKNIMFAELGMRWTFGPNANANHFVYYDDAVVAPGAVQCF